MYARKLSQTLFCLFGTLLVSAQAAAEGYGITGLGTLGGSSSYAYAINNNGQVVGEASVVGNTASHAYLYSSGVMTDLGTLGGADSFAVGINNSGQIVGSSVTSSSNTHAFLYSSGSMLDLGTLGGSNSYATGINTAGQVVGAADAGSAFHAFVYNNGSMTDLGMPGTINFATGINDHGQIAVVNEIPQAGLYSNGLVTPLGTLGGSTSFSNEINNNGQIVGSSYISGNTSVHAFLYSNGGMIDLGSPSGMDSFAFGINSGGMVVGQYQVAADAYRAFLYSNGVLTDLNSLIDPNSGWTLTEASDINDAGQIVGTGIFNGQQQAFLLTPTPAPVPLPAAVWLLGSGLLGLFVAARRKRHA